MTIERARHILAKATSGAPKKIRGSRRGWIRRAVRFMRLSSERTYCDTELVLLVEGMLDRNETRWPEPHEIAHFVVRDPRRKR